MDDTISRTTKQNNKTFFTVKLDIYLKNTSKFKMAPDKT